MADLGFVVFSDDWGRHPSAPQHLFARVAAEHPVIWVETAGLRDPSFSVRDVKRSAEKLRSWTGEPTASWWAPLPAGMTRVVAPMLPWAPRGPLLTAARRAVDRAVIEAGIRDPRCVVTVPTAVDLALPTGPTVAWCVDDFTLWPGYAHERIRGCERRLLAGSVGLLASAAGLLAARQGAVPRAELLEHGVDFERFASPGEPPPFLASLAGPCALFAGKLDERVDLEALALLSRERPDLQIVLLGERTVPLGSLAERANVHPLPAVPYPELPAWVGAADVLLMPYRRTAQTESISPLKLREYLASGVPVAATPLPEVERIAGSLVEAGQGSRGLVEAVRAALLDGSGEARQDAVRDQSWERRAEQLVAFVRGAG